MPSLLGQVRSLPFYASLALMIFVALVSALVFVVTFTALTVHTMLIVFTCYYHIYLLFSVLGSIPITSRVIEFFFFFFSFFFPDSVVSVGSKLSLIS